ncbi:DNA-processing protein DprA [Phycisphaerales bacterium AB-hyl4]|uniref:DNA-processing protein DprA n=1 Tax=Natronomicrosphaera hydrolytica TaxID=3242702 RepID=A0ABV4TZG9_9BACT
MPDAPRRALLTLLLTPGFGPTRVNRCIEAFGSAEAALGVTADKLARVQGIGPGKTSSKLAAALADTLAGDAVDRELEQVDKAGVALLGINDASYPRLLKHIPDPPPLLWVRGRLRDDDALALGVVGSRRCTHYGREQAERLSYQCAEAGLCIVSGGAYGIDAASHRGALRAKGRTIAVLGSGLAKPYPKEHIDLFAEIVASDGEHGAVISEFPTQTPPTAENFPRRNRIVSGLSLGVLVVEAARRSGALITARLCVEEHGRELLVLPGRVDSPASEGCHKMIREGWATLVTNAADILDGLGEAGQLIKANLNDEDAPSESDASADATADNNGSLFERNLTDTQTSIVKVLAEPCSLDQVAAHTGLPVQTIQADLTMLEIRGAIQRRGGLFVRRASNS